MKINENDKVLITSDDDQFAEYKGKVATVKRIYTEVYPPIAYVVIEESPTIARTVGLKVPLADLLLIPDEHKPEIPDGARKITKDDFAEALNEVTSPERALSNSSLDLAESIMAVISVRVIGDSVKNEIFRDSDSVVMDEDQFIAALWIACNPVKVSENTLDRMSARECTDVTLVSFITLKDIVPILFGESEK